MNITDLVEELEDIVETASQIPLTNKVMIEREEMLEILNEIKIQIPGEIAEAQQISSDKERIIKEANEEADKIITSARSHAEKIIAEDELVREATERSKQILNSAKEESTQIREGARDYADELL